jgi:hypothetical protein
MPFFCSCRICKINSKDGKGKVLSTKKTFKKHQEREKECIEGISETEIESSNESLFSSCSIANKRKFEEFEDDELDESDESDESNESNGNESDESDEVVHKPNKNLANSFSDNISFSTPLILEDLSRR